MYTINHHSYRSVNHQSLGLLPNRTSTKRDLVVVKGRHDRHTSKSERRPKPRQLEHPYQQQEQKRRRERRAPEDEEEELGWWQQPKQSNAEPESDELEEWQIERLEEAYAVGRRKVAISKISDELNLDRSFIISWFKEFSQRPEKEIQAIVARHKQRLQQQQGAMSGPVGDPLSQRNAADSDGPSTSGYVPFYVRQEMGLSRRKLSSETLRTLEALYDRTPYPSNDVIKGLYDMYKLPREVAIEWFDKRRQLDESRRQEQAAAAGGAAVAAKPERRKDMWSFVHGGKQQQPAAAAAAAAAGPRSELSELLGDAQLPESVVAAAAAQQQSNESVYTLTAKELVKVRSSLPSPRKQKGLRLAEELSIKASSKVSSSSSSSSSEAKVQEQLQIAGIKYTTSDGQQLWRQRWRRWRAREGLPGRHLDWGQWYTFAELQSDDGLVQWEGEGEGVASSNSSVLVQ